MNILLKTIVNFFKLGYKCIEKKKAGLNGSAFLLRSIILVH